MPGERSCCSMQMKNYLELAKAKGLSQRVIDQRYVLRPTLPYLITSFSMLLVGLWQQLRRWNLSCTGRALAGFISIVYPMRPLWATIPRRYKFCSGRGCPFCLSAWGHVLILDIVYAMVDPRVRMVTMNNRSGRWWPERFAFSGGYSSVTAFPYHLESFGTI